MPLDPVVQRRDVVEKQASGLPDLVLTTQHEAKCEADGVTEIVDPVKDYDIWVARKTIRLLMDCYPGYPWAVESDAAAHLLKISIPILMGVGWWYLINLRTTEASQGAILTAGGEILERYGLKRGKMQLAQYLEAREQHSALVVPSRLVPA